jgi:hypothetical protein
MVEGDITNKWVLIKADIMKPEYRSIKERLFHAENGFGCSGIAIGTAVSGEHLDGERCRYERYQIEKVATEKQISKFVPENWEKGE